MKSINAVYLFAVSSFTFKRLYLFFHHDGEFFDYKKDKHKFVHRTFNNNLSYVQSKVLFTLVKCSDI